MRSASAWGLIGVLGLSLTCACASSSNGAPTATVAGEVTLEGVTAKRGASVLRFTATVKNATTKAIKTLDSIEVDTGAGPKKATSLRECESAIIAAWLVKGGRSATVDFTLRSNGPDRQAVEAACLDAKGAAAGPTSLWEFQTFTVVDTNGTSPVKIAMNGTLDDGSIWSATASSQ